MFEAIAHLPGNLRPWIQKSLWVLLLGLLPSTGVTQRVTVDLAEGWTFRASGTTSSWPATVPGSIHNDLLLNGLIQDPFYGTHALELGWVDSTDWIYERMVTWPEGMPADAPAWLVFEGLDTWAEIWLDERQMAETDNMFRCWRVPIPDSLRRRPFSLRVAFRSAIREGAARAREVPFSYPADSDPYPGKPSVFTRKAPFQFGWDIAPSMPGCGIWRPVRLEVRTGPVLEDGWVETVALEPDSASVVLHGSLTGAKGSTHHLSWRIGDWSGSTRLEATDSLTPFSLPLRLPHPRLWWPAGVGDPFLYPVEVRISSPAGEDRLAWKTGIRTVRLERLPDPWGTSFRFVVNGQPLFLAGANWVPADMFPGRVTQEKYRHLLGLAAEAGMNMLRVWGGGIYEHDLFYQLADSLGLLIWQDFMFAGTMYPGHEPFLQNVAAEAEDQVRRLRGHPSVALWCGNNEIEVAWKNWGWPDRYHYTPDIRLRMEADYRTLFLELLPGIIARQHPGTDYLPSSPVSNWGTREELDHGNNHFWGVWHGEMPLDSLRTRIPRFMTEYGMPSWPVWESLLRCTAPDDLFPGRVAVLFRLRSYKGPGLFERYLTRESLDGGTDLRTWIAAGHEVQRRALETAIRAHLADRPRCAGTLLWQFNEPWPGATWSIVDYYGHPKPAWRTVKDLYRSAYR